MAILIATIIIIAANSGGNREAGYKQTPNTSGSNNSPTPPDPEALFAKQQKTVEQIQERLNKNTQYLKKYYATTDLVKQSENDLLQLVIIKVAYSKSTEKEKNDLAIVATELISEVGKQTRIMYASALEQTFVKNGMDITVTATGKNRTCLQITYALMSKPLVYRFQNEAKLADQAKPLGFTTIVYTNGFDSSLGETWTVKLTE